MTNPSASVRDLYQEATDRLIKSIESTGTAPWEKPWDNVATGPLRNGATSYAYRGINTVLLYLASLERGLTDARWVTFNQAKANAWKIKKGAKSERIYFYKPLIVDERDFSTGQVVIDAATGKPRQKQIPFLTSTPVFSAHDIEGIPSIGPGDVSFSPIEAGEAILQRSPVEIRYGGNSAHYNRMSDSIALPDRDQFRTPELFYATACHEIIHSTAHESRCHRELGKCHGDNLYAREELVAEIGSFLLSNLTAIPSRVEHHASYIQSWLSILKSDKKAIFTAAAKASQAVDFIMERQLEAKVEQQAEADASAKATEKPAPTIDSPVPAAKSEKVIVPATVAVVAKLRERRAKQSATPAPNAGPALRA